MPNPFIPFPKGCFISLRYTQYGSIMENTLWIFRDDLASGYSISELNDICGAGELWWTTHLAPLTSNTVTLFNVTARDMSEEDGNVVNFGFLSVGALTAEPLPTNVTYVTTFNTGRAGRSYRGRNYFVGMVDTQTVTTDRNRVTTTFADALTAAYGELNDILQGINPAYSHHVASRMEDGVLRTEGVLTPVIGYYHADFYTDSRRPRLSGRGG